MENGVVMLNDEQRDELEKFVKNGVHSAKQITRARVILGLDRSKRKDHLRISRIAENIQISRQAIYDIRDDFFRAENIEAFLTRKKRETPPVPAKITGDVEARIIAVACGTPPEGYASWSLRLLSEKCVELKILDSLSHTSAGRLLKKRNLGLT